MTSTSTSDEQTEAPVVLAVDSSTTSTKAIAFDLAGRALAEARRDYPRSTPRPGWQEQDAEHWWEATAGAVAEVAVLMRDQGHPVLSLCITHQRESFVLLDEDDRPLRPAVLWLDTRAGEQIRRVGSDRVHAISGKPASTTPSFYKLIWLAENEPELLARTRRVAEVHAYLVNRLTGVWQTSWATADPMALTDMRTFDWSPDLLGLAGLDREQLVDVVPPGQVIAPVTDAVADELGLPHGLPVVAGAGDGQSAGLGANVTGADRAYLSLGTSITMGIDSPEYLHSRALRTLSSPIAGQYTLEALLSSGALCISWFCSALSGMSPEDGPIEPRLEELAREVPAGSRGVGFLPYLTSAETPHWDADARGLFVGFTDTHGPAEFYRAVLEGLALEQRGSLAAVERATGTRVERLSVLGGAARSELFLQIIADVLQRPLDVCAEVETTCLGAAILGAAAVGAAGTHDVRETADRMSRVSHVVEPDPAHAEVYDLAASVHERLYPAVKDTFGTIAQIRELA